MSSEGGPSSPRVAPVAAASPPNGASQEETQAPPADILPAAYWAEQALEDDADSALDDSEYQSSTASLTSSIHAYRTLHGRTYNSDRITDNQNWTPNDENHVESAALGHEMCMLVQDGKLFRSPLKDNLEKVIDIGTGTGHWALEFADKYPGTTVIGNDISPIQETWVPPNLQFELDDVTQEWPHADNTFDFTNIRLLVGCIDDWPRLIERAYRCCKPGGYVESLESSCIFRSDDGTLVEGSPLDQWGKVFGEAGKKSGRLFDMVDRGTIVDAFNKAGFVDVTEWTFKCPVGTWPADPKLRQIGMFYQQAMDRDLEGYVLYIWTQVMGWSKEEVLVYAAHLRRQLRDRKVHSWITMSCVYGRKPEAGETATASS